MTIPGTVISLRLATWNGDSYGLFDFESKNLNKLEYQLKPSRLHISYYVIKRTSTEYFVLSDRESIPTDCTLVCEIRVANGIYTLHQPEKGTIRLWDILRSRPNQSCDLRVGDRLKLGRFEMRIRELVLSDTEVYRAEPDLVRPKGFSPINGRPQRFQRHCTSIINEQTSLETNSNNLIAPVSPSLQQQLDSETAIFSQQSTDPTYPPFKSASIHQPVASPPSNPANSLLKAVLSSHKDGINDHHIPNHMCMLNSSLNSSNSQISPGPLDSPQFPKANNVAVSQNEGGRDISSAHLSPTKTFASDSGLTSTHHQQTDLDDEDGPPACRICLEEEEDEECNPLIAPCTCRGSMAFVHLNCLRRWMEGRLRVPEEAAAATQAMQALEAEESFHNSTSNDHHLETLPPNSNINNNDSPIANINNTVYSSPSNHLTSNSNSLSLPLPRHHPENQQIVSQNTFVSMNSGGTTRARATSFFFCQLSCELCKLPYPPSIIINGQTRDLLPLPRPLPPYSILEAAVVRQRSGPIEGLHVVSLAANAARLGRSADSEIRVNDISVSRLHATMCLSKSDNSAITLQDQFSKFGSAVLLPQSMKLPNDGSSFFCQAGRTVIWIRISPPGLLKKINNSNDEQKQHKTVKSLFLCCGSSVKEPTRLKTNRGETPIHSKNNNQDTGNNSSNQTGGESKNDLITKQSRKDDGIEEILNNDFSMPAILKKQMNSNQNFGTNSRRNGGLSSTRRMIAR